MLRNIPNSESNVSYILFDIFVCFDVSGFELSKFNSIAPTSKKEEKRISFEREHIQIITFTQMILAKMRRL